jgi:phage terminase large subunit GpA-like protein
MTRTRSTTARALTNWRRIRSGLFRSALAPAPRLTVSEWSDRYRMLSREASAEPGRWSTDRAPYQRGILDAFSEPLVDTVVVMSSAQVGKTEVVNNVVGYYIDRDPAPILVLQPTVQMGEAWSKDRLSTMLRDTPKLRGKVKDPRSRDSGNTLLHKTFPGGHITIAGANSAAGLASRPIRVVLADEVDRFPASAGTEGDPLSLATKRTATFWNRKLGYFSTPTLKGFSRIEAAFQESDQRRYYVPCPHCAHRQTLVWERLLWTDGNPDTAAYACEACGALIEEQDKGVMLAGGVWVAGNPGARAAGFHLNALYSPWARWAELVREFLAAAGNPERLKVWINTVLGETWEEQGETLNHDALSARRERYAAPVPAGAGILTAGVDVQGDRLEVTVRGWGRGEESWLIHWEAIFGDPGRPEVWQTLEATLTRGWAHESGAELRIEAACIDTGGHHTAAVYEYVKPRQSRRVYAVKGASTPGRPLLSRASRANRAGVKLFTVGTDTAKDVLFSRLRIVEAGPGYLHFPAWLEEEYFRQLTAEKVVTRFRKGRPVRYYEKTRPRNEALDLEVYALAALHSLGTAVTQSLGARVERANADGAAVRAAIDAGEPEPAPTAPVRGAGRRRGGGWVNSWR